MKRLLTATVVLLFVGAAVAKFFVFELPVIMGSDMAPTLQSGDRLLANRLGGAPERGDLVLLEHPEAKGRLLIRRVVGLAGETVGMREDRPVIDGKRAQHRVQRRVRVEIVIDASEQRRPMNVVQETIGGASYPVLTDPKRRGQSVKPVHLHDAYYVLADNRHHATDSRTFGPVARSKIRAIVTHRVSAGPGSVLPRVAREGFASLR